MGQKCLYWPEITTNACYGLNLVVFGPKVLNFTGGSINFGTQVTEKPSRHLVCFVFWSGMRPNGPKMPIFGNKASIGPQILIFMGVSQSFGTHITERPPRQLDRFVFGQVSDQMGQNYAHIWPKMLVLGQIWPFFGQKSNFLGAGSITFDTLISGFQ